MPKAKLIAPVSMSYTADNMGMPSIDGDNRDPTIEMRFKGNSSIEDGVSGKLSIDTDYENITESWVEHPRSGADSPVDTKRGMYPHRSY